MSILNSVMRRTLGAALVTAKVAGTGVGLAAEGTAKLTGAAVRGTTNAIDTFVQPLGNKIVDVGAKALDPSKMVKLDKDGIPTKLSGRGKAMVGAITLAGIGYNGLQERIANDMGHSDGKIYSATPDYSVYNQKRQPSPTVPPAGADGSLVFALDRTKNGGFL